MKIKVCGLTDINQIMELSNIPVDLTGMIFYPSSPRSVIGHLSAEEVNNLSISPQKVGVFVNETVEIILKTVEDYGLDMVQLHGDETVVFCNQVSDHVKLIKAFRIDDMQTDIDRMVKSYEDACDYYLFDKGSIGIYGGTGNKFDWTVLSQATINKPFFLSGGISLEDVNNLKAFEHPFLYGIDINSRFETSPGIKDIGMIKEFMSQMNLSDQKILNNVRIADQD